MNNALRINGPFKEARATVSRKEEVSCGGKRHFSGMVY